MSLPHVCECRICGTTFPLGQPLGVPAEGNILGLDILALKPTCDHGYTICKPCKFPPDPAITEDANGDSN